MLLKIFFYKIFCWSQISEESIIVMKFSSLLDRVNQYTLCLRDQTPQNTIYLPWSVFAMLTTLVSSYQLFQYAGTRSIILSYILANIIAVLFDISSSLTLI